MTGLILRRGTIAALVASIVMSSQVALACSPEIKLDGATGSASTHPDLAIALAELNEALSVADAAN